MTVMVIQNHARSLSFHLNQMVKPSTPMTLIEGSASSNRP